MDADAIGIIAILSIVVVAVIAFILIIRSTLTLEKQDKNRIIDLLVVGAIIYLTHMIMPTYSTIYEPTALAGSLIFLYGFLILIYKKFEEGYRESRKEK
ncbi:MAG TPA: hypothetical protein C5S37_09650 [Methanophagales archaeon]|nr:hypothetical protein [Methanophagales archaeon]